MNDNFSFALGFLGYVFLCVGLIGYVIGRLSKPGNFHEVTGNARLITKGMRARMDPSARWHSISRNVAAPLSTFIGGALTLVSHLAVVGADASQTTLKYGWVLILLGVFVPPVIATIALFAARYFVVVRGRHRD